MGKDVRPRNQEGVRSKMTRKGEQGQRLDKGESLYSPKLAAKAKQIILEAQLIKSDGSLHYTKIARILGVPARTFSHWRNPESKYYKPEFAKALKETHEELLEGMQVGRIKQAMIKRASSYTNIKTIKEKVVRGPKMPAMSSMDKKGLLLSAIKLGIQVSKTMTRGVLKVKIAEEIVKQTKEVLVTTRQEIMRMHGDVNAAKLVLPNIGPKDTRWVPQAKLDVEGQSLADIAAIMMGKRAG